MPDSPVHAVSGLRPNLFKYILSGLVPALCLLIFWFYLLDVRTQKPEPHFAQAPVAREKIVYVSNGDQKPKPSPEILNLGEERNVSILWDPSYHVYRVNGKPVIWAFWDKPKMPAIIRLSLATILCHNKDDFHLQVVHEGDFYKWIDHVHPAFKHLILAHKADYFRARVLDTYGGIYIDADSLGFKSFWYMFSKLLWYDLCNISWPPDGDKMAVGVVGPIRAHSKMTGKWVTNLHLLLDGKLGDLEKHTKDQSAKYPLNWGQMLREVVQPILSKLLEDPDFRYFSVNGHTTFGQLVTSGMGPVTEMSNPNRTFKFRETELLMYHNSAMPQWARDQPIEKLLKSDYLVAALVRYSMAECKRGATKGHQMHERQDWEVKGQENLEEDLMKWVEGFMKENGLD